MVLIRRLVNSRLLVVKFGGESKVIHAFSTVQGVGAPNPCIVQESTVLLTIHLMAAICSFWLKMRILFCFILEGRKEGTEGKEVKENDLHCRYKNEFNTSYIYEVYHYFKNVLHKPCLHRVHILKV